jgi:hypothetical protein
MQLVSMTRSLGYKFLVSFINLSFRSSDRFEKCPLLLKKLKQLGSFTITSSFLSVKHLSRKFWKSCQEHPHQ